MAFEPHEDAGPDLGRNAAARVVNGQQDGGPVERAVNANLPATLDFISDGVDGDNNGYVDDISGWDFFENDNDPDDEVEGCLSVPDQYAEVERPDHIRARWLDEHGKPHEEQLDGLLAVCLQHEMDHLEGVLFIDHLRKMLEPVREQMAKLAQLSDADAGQIDAARKAFVVITPSHS